MALRCLKVLRAIRGTNTIRHNVFNSTSVTFAETEKVKPKEYRTENNLVYFEDPDKFGTLSPRINTDKVILQDEGDIREEKFIQNVPLPSQKLSTRQYADLIKQYIQQKRLKEAINILEVRMLNEDRVKPENYIYNILIGACADVGYTQKAFKLFNDMKRRALRPTGDTYTCLFHACSNSPYQLDGLKRATNLRQLMTEKGVEPNLTNYNAMIKAFGRCGDLSTAFKIVDEMLVKKIKIRVHTFNHLLQACISDKENGLRHALTVWRKMLTMKEKPNIYTFNLMLKCVKDCNLGSKADIQDLIGVIQEQIALSSGWKSSKMESAKPAIMVAGQDQTEMKMLNKPTSSNQGTDEIPASEGDTSPIASNYNETPLQTPISYQNISLECGKELTECKNISMQIVNNKEVRTLPNLLSKQLQLDQVLSLQAVLTEQEKFTVVGGQEDFLKEMEVYSVKPDIKTFTQMLPLLENSTEAENKLLETMKASNVIADIDFYNMLIKKRCLRLDYDAAFDASKLIEKESKRRRRKFSFKKKIQLKPNIMTYGVLAMACKTKENAEQLLSDIKEAQIKVNIEILGTLLRQGTAHSNFGYVLYIMNMVKEENLQPNQTFLSHMETFNEKCTSIIHPEKHCKRNQSEVFIKSYNIFSMAYKNWLKEVNIEEALKPEKPWAQFEQTYPETLQRQNNKINQPKKFYKRNRKFVKYVPTV